MASDEPILPARRAYLAAAGLLAATPLARAVAGADPKSTAPVQLSLNESDYGPSPLVRAAIARALETPGTFERYVRQDEVDALAARIARLEQVSADQVILGEVLAPLGLQLARRHGGGTILYSAPGYTELVDAALPLGGRGLPVPLTARLENDLPAFTRAIDDRTIAVSLVNPHNPSGTVNDADAFDAFVTATARRTLVIVDEAYLEYDDLPRRSAIRFARAGANVIVFRTLGKIYGLAGLTIGYAIAPPSLAASLREAGVGGPHTLNRLALIAATAALADHRHVATVRARNAAERERLTCELDRLRLEHSDSRASFLYFRSPGIAADDRAAFARLGIEIARVFPPLDGWIRITIGRPEENDRVIAALRAIYRPRPG